MSRLNMQIEKLRDEVHVLIEHNNLTSEAVIKKSQELDKLIVAEQLQQGGVSCGEILC